MFFFISKMFISILRLRFFGRTIERTIGILFKNKRNLISIIEAELHYAYKKKSIIQLVVRKNSHPPTLGKKIKNQKLPPFLLRT